MLSSSLLTYCDIAEYLDLYSLSLCLIVGVCICEHFRMAFYKENSSTIVVSEASLTMVNGH